MDDPEPEVHAFVYKLDNPTMLPFVIVADAQGEFVAGAAGAQTPERLLDLLEEALGD